MSKPMSTASRVMLALTALASIGSSAYILSTFDIPKDHELYEGEGAGTGAKLVANVKYMYGKLFDKDTGPLLPDPLPPPLYKPYTLVVQLEDVLVHSKYDPRQGYVNLKRPGMDAFLKAAAAQYEVVVWSIKSVLASSPIILGIDKYKKIFAYQLYKNAAEEAENGDGVLFNLDRLNRPLTRTIVLTSDPNRVANHLGNALLVPSWSGNTSDNELNVLVPFLSAVVKDKVKDVRILLKYYGHDNVGRKFRAHMAERKSRLAAEKAKARARAKAMLDQEES